MPLSQEYHISTRTFLQHVKVSAFTALLPIVLASAFILYLKSEPPFLMYWIIGASVALELFIWGGFLIAWEFEPRTRWGRRAHENAPEVYPPLMLMMRYALYAFCYLVAWEAAKALGLRTNAWMNISFYAKLLIHPVNRFFTDILEPSRRKRQAVATALVRMLNLNITISLVLSLFSTTTIADAIRHGDNLPLAIVVFVPVVLVVVSSFILFLDFILRYDIHARK